MKILNSIISLFIIGPPVESIDLLPNEISEINTLKDTIEKLSDELKYSKDENNQQMEINNQIFQQLEQIKGENKILKDSLK